MEVFTYNDIDYVTNLNSQSFLKRVGRLNSDKRATYSTDFFVSHFPVGNIWPRVKEDNAYKLSYEKKYRIK